MITILGEGGFQGGLQVEQHQMKSIGFETGPIHRRVGELRAVRRECGLSVPRFVVGGEIFRRRAAVGGGPIHLKIPPPRFPLPASPPESHRRAVRTECTVTPAAPRLAPPLTPPPP